MTRVAIAPTGLADSSREKTRSWISTSTSRDGLRSFKPLSLNADKEKAVIGLYIIGGFVLLGILEGISLGLSVGPIFYNPKDEDIE